MGRYAVDGSVLNQVGISLSSTGGATPDATSYCFSQYLLGASGTSGRTFWLRSFRAYNTGGALVLTVYDATIATATLATAFSATAGGVKARIMCASGVTTVVDFPAPGLKFTTSCQVARTATTTATAAFGPGDVAGSGYEE